MRQKDYQEAVAFFYEHAPYSHRPPTETPQQGRQRCARLLAVAEDWGYRMGLNFIWEQDPDIDSRDHGGVTEDGCWYPLYQCLVYDRDWEMTGVCLGGIDLGPTGEDPTYKRVVEAELAMEARDEWRAAAESARDQLQEAIDHEDSLEKGEEDAA